MSDRETLEALNHDYISSVQHRDVRRFDEILAAEFYCSNPDGSRRWLAVSARVTRC
ncbi:MAG: hypothetical protein WEG40_15440 [Candidatus Rokuibacteriota bacterium]